MCWRIPPERIQEERIDVMTPKDNVELQRAITWDFTINEGAFVARYGKLGEDHYRQFLPAGIPNPALHPPRKIHEALYQLALRRFNREPLKD